MDEKPVPSYATNKYRKRPRNHSEWSILRYWEIERGYPTGHIGNRVWVDSLDHSKGFYELGADGNEQVGSQIQSKKKGDKQMENESVEEFYKDVTGLIAKMCHNVNKAYCEAIGDLSQPSWEDAPDWQKESAMAGVLFHLENEVTPEQSHVSWMREKTDNGWVYGEVKNPENKTHPCIVDYDKLPQEQRVKDHLFKAIVDSFK